MKKKYQIPIIISIILLLILYIINANLIIKNILDYTNLFINKLFPTTFIIYILSSILIDYEIINILSTKRTNGNIIYVTLMSILSGFPSGVKYTKDLLDKNLITKETGNYLITYTNFPNPLFLLGSISTVLNKKLTLKLFIIIIISNLLIAIIFKPKKLSNNENKYKLEKKIDFSTSLKNATNNSIKTLLIIYSTSLFFYLISVIINKYFSLVPINYIILNSFLDLTKGIFSTTLLSNIKIRAYIILVFLSFGSISIHMQIKSIISDTSLKYKNYLLGRIIQVLIASFLFFLITKNN